VTTPFFLTRWLARTGVARWLPSVRRLADGSAAYLHHLSDRVLATPFADLQTAADFWEAPAGDAIDLALPAPRFDLAPSGSTKLPADRRGYPALAGLPELRAAVAELLRAESNLDVNPADEVLITHGAAGAFHTVLDAFLRPGDRVVLFDPCSSLFSLSVKQRRARIRWVPTMVEEGRTRFPMEPFTRALPNAKLLVLANPSNPAGGTLAPEDVEQIVWWATKYDVLIYDDESFGRFRYEGETVSPATWPKGRGRTLTAGGVSKGYALASARVGWLAAHRHLLRPCLATAALNNPFVPTVCQQVALAALRQSDAAFAPILEEFAAKRRYAYERLQGLGFEPDWPAGGFFLWVPVARFGMTGREFAERFLHSKRVLVTPGELYGPSGAGHVRISYALDDGRLREGLTRLAEFVGEATTPVTESCSAEAHVGSPLPAGKE
jgi:aspartate/methionine/tyrosine aminotransferase